MSFTLFLLFFFFFNDTSTTDIYTLSLHDALPIWRRRWRRRSSSAGGSCPPAVRRPPAGAARAAPPRDRKSTRLNSSHQIISYAVFCLKKKKKHRICRIQTIHKQKQT